MKRDFLESLGITEKEVIDAILDENSSDIGKVKAEVKVVEDQNKELQQQLSDRNADIEELSKQAGDNSDLQAKYQELQDKYQGETEANSARFDEIKRDSAVELALTKAGARNIKAAKALLNLEEIKVTDDGIEGLDSQVTALTESDSYLFGTGESTGAFSAGGNPTGTAPTKVTQEAFDRMSYSERLTLSQEQPETFKQLTGGI